MLSQVNRNAESELVDAIDKNRMNSHLDVFEDLQRVAGSEDEWEASEYIVDTLNEYGIEADINSFEGYISIPESASLDVNSPVPNQIDEVLTTSFSANTPSSGVHGELIQLNNESDIRDSENLSEKIVFVPELPKPHLASAASEEDAKGIVFQSPDENLHQGIVSPVWGTPDTSTADNLPSVPVIEVTNTDGKWLTDQMREGPTEITLKTKTRTELTTLPNPVGRIEGDKSDRYLIIGNHVDSWFEGITDNATAMAATLEIARIFADRKPHRGLIFGFWTAHSTGRYSGSARYVDDNWVDLHENGVAYLHLDLNGLTGADSLWYQNMAELEDEHIDSMKSATKFDIRDSEESYLGSTGRPARNSDQSFWGPGLSSLLSGARLTPETEQGGPIGGGWWWHTPEDTRDKVDMDVLVEETKLYVTLAARICESLILPHDYRATVDDIKDVLNEIERNAENAVTFEAAQTDLDELRSSIDEMYETFSRAEDEPDFAQAIEGIQVQLGNALNPILYMSGPDTKYEPATPYRRLPYLREAERLPSLSGREELFARTAVKRGQSRLRYRVRDTTKQVNQFLAQMA